MSLSIVLDTDFLSAFLKVERLSLIKEFFQVEFLLIPSAVYSELSVTRLSQTLAKLPWVHVEAPSSGWDPSFSSESLQLGAGELQAIALARQCDRALLLSNDNIALKTGPPTRVEHRRHPRVSSSLQDLGIPRSKRA